MKYARIGMVLVAATLTGVLVACGSSVRPAANAPASTAGAVDTAHATESPTIDYKQQYLDLIAPVNKVIEQLRTAPPNSPDSYFVPILTNLADAIQTLNGKALRAQWPTNAQQDVRSMSSVDGEGIGAIESLITAIGNDSIGVQQALANVQTTMAKWSQASNVVRADLGLPAPPSS